jgi:hypothetical protein
MSATALADDTRTEPAGATLRLYVPGLEEVPRLGPAPCGFTGCLLRATRREWIGSIYLALVCDGHVLFDPQ